MPLWSLVSLPQTRRQGHYHTAHMVGFRLHGTPRMGDIGESVGVFPAARCVLRHQNDLHVD